MMGGHETISDCVIALAEILENLIKIQENLNDSNPNVAQQPSPCPALPNSICTEPNSQYFNENGQPYQFTNDQEINNPDNQWYSLPPPRTRTNTTCSDFDKQNDSMRPRTNPCPDYDRQNETMRTRTNTTCADYDRQNDTMNQPYYPSTSHNFDECCTKSNDSNRWKTYDKNTTDGFQKIVAIRENSDGTMSKIYALRKQIKPTKRSKTSIRVTPRLSHTNCNTRKPDNTNSSNYRSQSKSGSFSSICCAPKQPQKIHQANDQGGGCSCSSSAQNAHTAQTAQSSKAEDFSGIFEELKFIIDKEKERIEALQSTNCNTNDFPCKPPKKSRIICPFTEDEATEMLNEIIETIVDGFTKITTNMSNCTDWNNDSDKNEDLKKQCETYKKTLKNLQLNIHDTLKNITSVLYRCSKVYAPEIPGMTEQMRSCINSNHTESVAINTSKQDLARVNSKEHCHPRDMKHLRVSSKDNALRNTSRENATRQNSKDKH